MINPSCVSDKSTSCVRAAARARLRVVARRLVKIIQPGRVARERVLNGENGETDAE